MSSNTNIVCEVDLEKNGRHSGFIRIPHSVHRSAYGWIPVPVVSVRNGDSPTVVLLGGNHGDEFEGQVALSRLARNLSVDQISGQVVILPMANYPAAKSGLRTSPLDGGNLNRSFPGNSFGRPTDMIAYFIETELLSKADFMLDIHSGGSSMRYRKPTLLVSNSGSPIRVKNRMALVDALDFPRVVMYSESRGASFSTSAAERQGALGITAEMAGGGNVDNSAMKLLETALPRYLASCGVYHGPVETKSSHTEFFSIEHHFSYLYARNNGIFEPAELSHDQTENGQIAGWIHYPDVPFTEPVELRFKSSGVVLSSRMLARVERGDCLYEIGTPSTHKTGG